MSTHDYVIQCPTCHVHPNRCALVRQYPDDDAMYWGCIDDALIADQEAAWIHAMSTYMTPERSGTLAEGWLSPDGRFYACAGAGMHEELAMRLCAYVYDTFGAGETLERAAAWMADYRLTSAQRRVLTGWYHTADARWETSLEPFLFDA